MIHIFNFSELSSHEKIAHNSVMWFLTYQEMMHVYPSSLVNVFGREMDYKCL